MNHAYYLNKMPQELRARIESQPVYAPWLARGHTLLTIWSDRTLMEILFNLMSPREQTVLRIVVGSIGCEPFDWNRLEKRTSLFMSGAEAKVGFFQLLRTGLVYTFRKTWGEHVYVLAEEGLAVWQPILFGDVPSPASSSNDLSDIELTEAIELTVGTRLFETLVFIRGSELKLTKHGTLYKKQQQKWEQLLTMEDERFQAIGLKYPFGNVYPLKLAVMLELLFRLQLVEQRGDQLSLADAALQSWLALSEQEQNRQLYAIWQQAAFPAAAWLQHAALLLERQRQGVWNGAAGMLHWLRRHGIIAGDDPAGDPELTERMEQQWIGPLIAFGWMEKGVKRTEEGMPWYRWRIHPLDYVSDAEADAQFADARFHIQPDFEVLVPPSVPYAVRWELSAIAEPQKSDQVSVYKLSKESLLQSLENGRQLETSLHFLERYALYGIPQNVRLTLEQWAKPFGMMQLARAILLRCKDEAVADTIRKLPGIDLYLAERLGERTWLVNAEKAAGLRVLLDKAGWIPGKMAILDGCGGAGEIKSEDAGEPFSTVESDTARGDHKSVGMHDNSLLSTADKRFFYSRQLYVYFEMERSIPEIRDLYPDLHAVPAGWLKEYRTYHASTRREMVEKAMELKTVVQVRHNGRDERIAPRKLQDNRGSWSMIGLEQSELQEVCLFPQDWQEMKIILPGINEK